jgi:hypothetical protein
MTVQPSTYKHDREKFDKISSEVQKDQILRDLKFKQILKNSASPQNIMLRTLEVKDKSVMGFASQILHNFGVGTKAYYFIARDIVTAKDCLTSNEFDELKSLLKNTLSRATIDKLFQIGSSDRLKELFDKDIMPLQWTTQYMICSMDEKQYNLVKDQIRPDITQREIVEQLGNQNLKGVKAKEFDKLETPKTFLKIAFEKKTADANKIRKISTLINQLVQDIMYEKVDYQLNKKEDVEFKAQVFVDHVLINKTEEENLDAIAKFDKDTKKQYLNAFENYFSQKLVA